MRSFSTFPYQTPTYISTIAEVAIGAHEVKANKYMKDNITHPTKCSCQG